jgi:hypothetical protein
MSIFSRIFQKEDGTEDVTPADGAPIAAVTAEQTLENPVPPALMTAESAPAPAAERGNGNARAAADTQPSAPKRASAELAAANDPARPARPLTAATPANTVGPPPVPPPRRSPQQARHKTPPPHRAAAAAEGEAYDKIETITPPPSPSAGPPRAPKAAGGRHAVYTAVDHAAIRSTFEDLSVAHVRALRNMMIDVKWGEPVAVWLDLARPALKSLRQMAEQVELADLVKAIDGFSAALDKGVQGGTGAEQLRDNLLEAYAPLVAALPKAFELDGERDRREPIIVQSVLRQVSSLEPLLMQRLYAVGLGRLDTLLRATAEEIAVVADLQPAVAAAVVAKVQELRRGADSAAEMANVRRAVQPLARGLQSSQQAYEKAAAGWSAEALAAKRRHRRDREQTFLQIKVALTRAGEVDLVQRMEMQPFARRLEELERFLREPAGTGSVATA